VGRSRDPIGADIERCLAKVASDEPVRCAPKKVIGWDVDDLARSMDD